MMSSKGLSGAVGLRLFCHNEQYVLGFCSLTDYAVIWSNFSTQSVAQCLKQLNMCNIFKESLHQQHTRSVGATSPKRLYFNDIPGRLAQFFRTVFVYHDAGSRFVIEFAYKTSKGPLKDYSVMELTRLLCKNSNELYGSPPLVHRLPIDRPFHLSLKQTQPTGCAASLQYTSSPVSPRVSYNLGLQTESQLESMKSMQALETEKLYSEK